MEDFILWRDTTLLQGRTVSSVCLAEKHAAEAARSELALTKMLCHVWEGGGGSKAGPRKRGGVRGKMYLKSVVSLTVLLQWEW